MIAIAPSASLELRRDRCTRCEARFASGRADDRNRSDSEGDREHQQQCAERRRHREHPARGRRNRHRHLRLTMRTRDVYQHPHRTVLHQPQTRGEEARVDWRALRDVGHGRILRARACEASHRSADLTHVVGVGANLHVGDAGNYRGNVDRHEQVIGAGVAFVKDVGTADVRVGGNCEQ
jgi:hypothetical protein